MRKILICVFALLLIVPCALAEYFTGADDPYFHAETDCVEGSILPISRVAADEFGKLPCPECVLSMTVATIYRGGITAVRAYAGIDDAKVTFNGQYLSIEENDFTYALMPREDELDAVITTKAGSQEISYRVRESELDDEKAVLTTDMGTTRFMAFDFLGVRLCALVFPSGKSEYGISEKILANGTEYSVSESYAPEYTEVNWLMTRAQYSAMAESGSFSLAYSSGKTEEYHPFFAPMWTGGEWTGDNDAWQTVSSETDDTLDTLYEESDFCGTYVNGAGEYTVMIKNPTEARAMEYKEMCGKDIWVVTGDYTYSQLKSDLSTAMLFAGSNLEKAEIKESENRVRVDVTGLEARELIDEISMPASAYLMYGGRPVDRFKASEPLEIERSPEYKADTDGAQVSMEALQYPKAADYISYAVNVSGAAVEISQSAGIWKWNGEWILLYGNFDTDPKTELIGSGTTNYCVTLDNIDTLGRGLYRVSVCKINGEELFLEFAVNDNAAAQTDFVKTEGGIMAWENHTAAGDAENYDSRTYENKYSTVQTSDGGTWIVYNDAGAQKVFANIPASNVKFTLDGGDGVFAVTAMGEVFFIDGLTRNAQSIAMVSASNVYDALYANDSVYIATETGVYRVKRSGDTTFHSDAPQGEYKLEYYDGEVHISN